ncbi:bifunctional metallophosphatase/5'-nucleotidase [candidate division KSB1 bacterium]|nr:bifunctional metallophosphatase/5'-nucleotidase [candidate division KSB1 bacterium]
MIKKLFFLLLLVGIQVGICQEGRITILHTNDLHAQYIPMEATWINSDPKPEIGGIVALEYFIRQQKKLFPQALVLDAGDMMTGTPVSVYLYNGVKGGGFVEMVNRVGYDVITIGNHAFDEGMENFLKLLPLYDAEVVSANLFYRDSLLTQKPYTIITKNNIRIGIIGVMLSGLFEITARSKLDGISVADPLVTVQNIVREIDPETDLIVLLSHLGHNDDIKLAGELQNVDVIVGGHSHYRMTEPIVTNGIIIVQAGSKTRYLGRLSVDVKADTVRDYEYELIPVWVNDVENPDTELSELVNRIRQDISRDYRRTVGTLKTDWIRQNYQESNVGQFIADAIRETCQADFALINSGGIRKDKRAGDISKLDMFEILPFTNYVVTFSCLGSQVISLLEKNLNAQHAEEYAILQLSGINARYKIDNGQVRVLSATINGRAVEPGARYLGASVDFIIVDQRENFLGFEPLQVNPMDKLITDVLIEYLIAQPIIEGRLEPRIQRID